MRFHNFLLNDKKIATVFGLSFFICVFFIQGYPIYILDEAKNSEAAREMLLSTNWIVPTFNDILRTDKPPLHYFFMIVSYKLFGVNEFAARFFSSVFGALTLTGAFYFVRKFKDVVTANLTWFILISALFFVQLFHQAVPDPYLVFFVSMSLFLFYDFFKNRSYLVLYLFYGFIGLGVLSKGPIAVALPGLIVAVFLFIKKELFTLKVFNYRPFRGLLLAALISIPWYVIVHKATNGAWTKGFFLDHNLNRFSSEMEGHGGIFIITWLFVILGLLPFSVFIIQGFKKAWRERKHDDFLVFSAVVSVVFIGFFSMSGTKLPNYTMPSHPFVAILIAYYLKEVISLKKEKTYKWSLIALLIISVLLPIGGFVALTLEKQLVGVRWLSLFLIIATFGAVIGFYFYEKRADVVKSISCIGISWVILGMVFFSILYPILVRQNPVSMAMDAIPKKTPMLAYESFDSAFPFNFQKIIPQTTSLDSVSLFLKKYPKGVVISNSGNRNKLLQLKNIEVVVNQKSLFEMHYTLIIKNEKAQLK